MTQIQQEPKNIKIGTTSVSKVFVGATQVRPSEWQPGANTLAYRPFENDALDKVGSATITGGTLTKASIGYNFSCTNVQATTSVQGGNFWSGWVKFNTYNDYYINFLASGAGLYFRHYERRLDNKFYMFTSSSLAADTSNNLGLSVGNWYYVCYGNYQGTWKFYINGTEMFTSTGTNYFGNDPLIIFGSTDRSNLTDNADISRVIVESVGWTQQEITDYYNQTKSDYGL